MFDRPSKRIGTAAVVAGLSLGAVGVASLPAIDPIRAESTDTSPAAEDPSEATLDAWVRAAAKLEAVRKEWAPKIRAARESGDTAKTEELSKKADREMVLAIKSTEGISLSQYKDIWERSQRDRDLKRRLEAKFKDLNSQ